MPSPLLIELKKRYRSPAEALKALGLSEKTITKLAMDENPDMPENAEECLAQLREMVVNLPPDEHEALLDGLREIVDSGDPGQWAATTDDEPDQPPEFPGRPEREGGQDRRRIAQDRAMTRRAIAFDRAHDTTTAARAAADFRRRFPNVPRVERV
jgi:hypothetical protein